LRRARFSSLPSLLRGLGISSAISDEEELAWNESDDGNGADDDGDAAAAAGALAMVPLAAPLPFAAADDGDDMDDEDAESGKPACLGHGAVVVKSGVPLRAAHIPNDDNTIQRNNAINIPSATSSLKSEIRSPKLRPIYHNNCQRVTYSYRLCNRMSTGGWDDGIPSSGMDQSWIDKCNNTDTVKSASSTNT
jgi:hypothetical protein